MISRRSAPAWRNYGASAPRHRPTINLVQSVGHGRIPAAADRRPPTSQGCRRPSVGRSYHPSGVLKGEGRIIGSAYCPGRASPRYNRVYPTQDDEPSSIKFDRDVIHLTGDRGVCPIRKARLRAALDSREGGGPCRTKILGTRTCRGLN